MRYLALAGLAGMAIDETMLLLAALDPLPTWLLSGWNGSGRSASRWP